MENNRVIDIDPLFLKTPITSIVKRNPPVVAVGLPRSGSSFLADIVSQIDDWYMFDDLYLYREAKNIGAIESPLTSDQLDKLVFFLGWQIRARIKYGTYSVPTMSLDEVDRMDQAIKDTFKDRSIMWYELLEEWMLRLAHNEGCSHWGYKAPQDFMYLELLEQVFPGVSFIYIKRDPRRMMVSLKFVNDIDGDPKLYHPVFYSIYWKNAYRIMHEYSTRGKVHNVKFENIIKKPQIEAEKIATFLKATVSKEIEVKKSNTSFTSKNRKALTRTELLICEKIIGQALEDNGYEKGQGQFRLLDIPELIFISFRFLVYQAIRVAKMKSALVSISYFIRTTFSFRKN